MAEFFQYIMAEVFTLRVFKFNCIFTDKRIVVKQVYV